jgi:biotin-dependent carboxylase-like uncharacterized protein
MSRSLRIERVGFTTLQDLGRPGWAHLGVPHSGAADRASHALANRLAGNSPSAATLETSGGLVLRAEHDVVVVLTGADCDAVVDGAPLSRCRATRVAVGQLVRVDRVRVGVRSYLAVAGGIDCPPLLGSRSHDALSGIVPLPLTEGTRLSIGSPHDEPQSLDVPIAPTQSLRIRVSEGPHSKLLAPELIEHLAETTWSVSARSSRIGVHLIASSTIEFSLSEMLSGTPLGGIDSIALVRGAVQLTPSGHLFVMLADHPTTGGYPVIWVTQPDVSDTLGQLSINSLIRFTMHSSPHGS